MKVVLLTLFTVLCAQYIEGVYLNYYWRDYNGDIPDDAIPGGTDLDLRPTYIGQAMLYNEGKYATIPGEIRQGEDYNYFPLNGYALPVRKFIKILCADPITKAKWISTSIDDFYTDIMGHNLVAGGSESLTDLSGNYTCYIGRVRHQDKWIVGKLVVRKSTDMTFYYVDDNTEYTSDTFYTLAYDN